MYIYIKKSKTNIHSPMTFDKQQSFILGSIKVIKSKQI